MWNVNMDALMSGNAVTAPLTSVSYLPLSYLQITHQGGKSDLVTSQMETF